MSTTQQSNTGAAPDTLGRTAALVAGDLIALMVFAAIGRRSHAEAAGFDSLIQIARTGSPFIIGWLLVSPWLGAYRRRNTSRPLDMLNTTAVAWTAAIPVGAVLRALFIGRFSPLSFYLVTYLVALLILVGWRLVWSLAEGRVTRK